MTLTEFLLARIAEDEVTAHDEFTLYYRGENPDAVMYIDWSTSPAIPPNLAKVYVDVTKDGWRRLGFRVRADTERMLAECKAKRQIVELHRQEPDSSGGGFGNQLPCVICQDETYPCRTIRLLALPHADHPDYDEGWRL